MKQAGKIISEEVFRYPKGLKRTSFLAAVFWFGLALIIALILVISPEWKGPKRILPIIVSLGEMAFVWYFVRVAGLANDHIEVSETGIAYVAKQGPRTFLPWGNISKLREREWMKCLELFNGQGHKAMSLGYQLDNFEQLRLIVYQHTGHLRKGHALEKVFHKQVEFYGLFIGGALLFGGGAWLALHKPQPEPWAAIGGAGITAYFIIVFLKEIITVDIGASTVTLKYVLWKRTMPYSDIADIFIQNPGRNKSVTPVFIKHRSGKLFKLVAFKYGGLILFDVLRTAWEACVGKQAVAQETTKNDS